MRLRPPPPAFERTGSHGFLWRNRRVFNGLGPDRAGNCGPETRDFPIPAANPPAVSEGGFFDHSFGDDANPSVRIYRSNPRNLRCSDPGVRQIAHPPQPGRCQIDRLAAFENRLDDVWSEHRAKIIADGSPLFGNVFDRRHGSLHRVMLRHKDPAPRTRNGP